jgi:His/Glu/Gln/Arg/opine family amino acid ABC transporter permease subunit
MPFIVRAFLEIISGLPATLTISLFSLPLGFLLGLGLALILLRRARIPRFLAGLYISFIRGTPLLVQLYLVYFGLPALFLAVSNALGLGLNVDAIPAIFYAVTAFTLNNGAFLSLVIKSAIESVDKTQLEAAESIGMTRAQGMRCIVLPQAFRNVIPMLGNISLSNIKSTSLAFSILVMELTAKTLAVAARGFRFVESYIVVSLIYFTLCRGLEKAYSLAEKKLRVY